MRSKYYEASRSYSGGGRRRGGHARSVAPSEQYMSVDIGRLSAKHRRSFFIQNGTLNLVRETERAVLLTDGRVSAWVPKSAISSKAQADPASAAEDVRELIGRLHVPLLHAEAGEYENILKVPLRQYQRDVLKTLDGRPRVAMFADMGTGKTPMSLARMILFDDGLPNLIICKKSLISQWRSEIDKFCPWMQDRIHIINYDMIFRDSAKDFLSQFRPDEFNLTLEEVGCLGNEGAKRTRKCMELASQCRNLQMLTGSFFGGRFEKFYPCAVMQGYEGTRAQFEDEYCVKVRQKVRTYANGRPVMIDDWRIVDYKNIPELIERTTERGAVFIRTEDCLELPPETRQVVTVPTTESADEASERIMASARSGVSPNNADLVLVRTGNDIARNADKMAYVSDLIEASDERWCVFYQYKEEREALAGVLGKLGRSVSEVSGRTRDLTAYEERSDSVTLIQIVAGAEGLNLQKCCHSIFTMPFNADQQLQAERRTRRMGQTRPCFYYILATDSAYDQARLADIQEKRDVVNSIG